MTDDLTDSRSAQAVQRLIHFQESQEGIVDAASGLTVDDIARVVALATSAQATSIRKSTIADIETSRPDRLADLLTTAILNTMAETSERLLGAPALPSNEAFDAIVGVLAVLVTADPERVTAKTIREEVDEVARQAKISAGKLKQMHEKVGYLIMPKTRPPVN